jgi:hypothetical protein
MASAAADEGSGFWLALTALLPYRSTLLKIAFMRKAKLGFQK